MFCNTVMILKNTINFTLFLHASYDTCEERHRLL